MTPMTMPVAGHIAAVLAIVVGALLSEDAATITAAAIAAAGILSVRVSFLSAASGLWIGDVGVYLMARFWRESGGLSRWLPKLPKILEDDARKLRGYWPLAVSRFFPGTRLVCYVAAGVNRMPFLNYAGVTALTAAIWTALVFLVVWALPACANSLRQRIAFVGAGALAAFALLLLWRWFGAAIRARLGFLWQRVVRWEFWPAWLFYAPVPFMCAWLGIRYRGLALPTISNLNQKNGGMIGESKMEILRTLQETSPDLTADAYLIRSGPFEARAAQVHSLLAGREISFPFVLKPDTAQRGAGFRKVECLRDAEDHLLRIAEPLLLQRYVPGPFEAGVFYYRFPTAKRGEIFGITRKRFPIVTGDGVRSLRQLIEADDRARFLKHVYLRRLGASADSVPALGEQTRLVEAGNHCQGCIFEDGWDLYSEPLRAAFDAVSLKLPGFFIGRFDLRYVSDEQLRNGAGFTIIELNGASSEATNLYDAKNSLWSAYRTLYRQWRLIYAIGAENRDLGARPADVLSVWRDWREFSARACDFPIAD